MATDAVLSLPVPCANVTYPYPVLTLPGECAGGGGGGPLARVQATPKATATSTASVVMVFAAPPTVGNGVVVVVASNSPTQGVTSCIDNFGNVYTLTKRQGGPSAGTAVDFWCCPKIAATGGSFTITAAGAAGISRMGVAIEASGVGAGLVADQNVSAETVAVGSSIGPTPALTADIVLLLAATGVGASLPAITVGVVTPLWLQEAEALSTTPVTAEIDSRVLTGALGTTQSVSWTWGGATYANSALVAFKAS